MTHDTQPQSLRAAWRGHGRAFAFSIPPLVIVLVLFSLFVGWVEERPGVVLDDPILKMLPVVDLTWPVFAIIYGGIVAAVATMARHPAEIILMLRAYTIMVAIRIAAMYLAPFDPPAGMITLIDPVAGLGPGGALTRDLFFSGHTATMFLLALCAPGRTMRWVFLSLTILLALFLLLQHVHYAIDVVAAPFFAYGGYRISKASRTLPLLSSGGGGGGGS